MALKDIRLPVTTDGSGNATKVGERSIKGRLVSAEWKQGTLAATTDATLSMTQTPSGVDRTVLTLTNVAANAWYSPRELVHDPAGTALTGTAGGDRVPAVLVGTPKLVIAQGGAAASGELILYYED